jgi:hypothetical protein
MPLIDLDKEMDDVEKVDGTITQPETFWQLKIPPTLLLTLRSWNLGRFCPKNPIPLLKKCTSEIDHRTFIVQRRKIGIRIQVQFGLHRFLVQGFHQN